MTEYLEILRTSYELTPPYSFAATADDGDEGGHGDVARGAGDGVAPPRLRHAEQAAVQSR